MIILSVRTDKPEAEISLYKDDKQITHESWYAHRELAETLHIKILELLKVQKFDWLSIKGIVAYKGPGSFTGLRIGLAVVNVLAYSLPAPIIGMTGEDWCEEGISRLLSGDNKKTVLPEYGAPVHITLPS